MMLQMRSGELLHSCIRLLQVSEEPNAPQTYPVFSCADRVFALRAAQHAAALQAQASGVLQHSSNALIAALLKAQLIRYAESSDSTCTNATLHHNAESYAEAMQAFAAGTNVRHARLSCPALTA